ncbi:hypothetical protein F0562_015727 [Nyssa sinensis]|uniref:Phytocyanin domain-containing protein n=1 Tax=Nyssa sinensis TaxID=561372 RepID=A0A5J4ZIC2_9ASTE|nr:hypothetical protein F0562_015727 [Nyssa sinensis]
MASMKSPVIFAIVAVVVLPTLTMATEFWVGDTSGWTVNFNYQDWAKDKVFHVGDSLVFNYTMGYHNVFKVDGAAFKDCVIPPANEALTSGHDVIPLKAPGKKWYICGVGDHCAKKGQKLTITVNDGAAPAPAPAPTDAASGLGTSVYHVLMAAVVAVALVLL